jgi:ATP-dependent RNA helicase DeaD
LCKEISNYRENLGFFPRLLLFSSSRLWFLENFLRPVVRFLKPGNILGAIANEADMDSEYIGSIQIFDDCSTIDLPDEMPSEVLEMLQKTVVCGKRLNMAELTEKNNKITTGGNRPSHKKRTTGRKKFSRNHKQGDEKEQSSKI